nr:hypothetical protein [Nocardia terpenica]
MRIRLRVVGELIDGLEGVDTRIKAADKELRQSVAATGSTLMELPGIGPARPGCSPMSAISVASWPGTGSRPGTAPRRWMRPREIRSGTGFLVPEIARSTECCTSWR